MNNINLIGRLTRDPEIRSTKNGKDVANFSIAVNRTFKQASGPDADFFRCVAWGKTAEVCQKYLEKGREVGVCGRLEINRYTDKDGNEKQSIDVQVSAVTLIGSKSDKKSDQSAKEDDAISDGLPF